MAQSRTVMWALFIVALMAAVPVARTYSCYNNNCINSCSKNDSDCTSRCKNCDKAHEDELKFFTVFSDDCMTMCNEGCSKQGKERSTCTSKCSPECKRMTQEVIDKVHAEQEKLDRAAAATHKP